MTRKALTLALLAAVLAAAGCGKKDNYLKQVGDPPALVWDQTLRLPVLMARFKLVSQVRDEGMYEGNLKLRTGELEREFAPRKVTVTGEAREGLVAEVESQGGGKRLVVYTLSTGEHIRDRARHEAMLAAAVLRLGMRRELEAHFRQLGLKVQLRGFPDAQMVTLVEVYVLAKLGFPLYRLRDIEKKHMAQFLVQHGIGDPGYKPKRPLMKNPGR